MRVFIKIMLMGMLVSSAVLRAAPQPELFTTVNNLPEKDLLKLTTWGLSLPLAEQLALQRDTLSKSFRQNELAFAEQARATDT